MRTTCSQVVRNSFDVGILTNEYTPRLAMFWIRRTEMLGGMISAPLISLFLIPVVYYVLKRNRFARITE